MYLVRPVDFADLPALERPCPTGRYWYYKLPREQRALKTTKLPHRVALFKPMLYSQGMNPTCLCWSTPATRK